MITKIVWAGVCLLIALFCLFTPSEVTTVEARSAGPPANRNGLTGVFCTACHTTNPLNSGEGSVRLLGLPSAWAPGETYELQVIVSHPSARRWGFQMSAVGADGDQAGEFIAGADERTSVQTGDVNGKSIQFIQHNSLGSMIEGSNVFQFTYRTPADLSRGAIRFNVAGNATNGNLANTGDFVYATETTVPAVTLSNSRAFVMATRGTSTLTTMSGSGSMALGHARVQTASGVTGAGMALMDFRQNGITVTETAFAASAPIRSGRIYAESGGSMNTGIAIANPNSQAAIVSFFFSDDAGANFGSSSITVGPNSQVAALINQAPFFTTSSRPITDARTLTFNSSVPVSALAVRTRTNERGEFMMVTLPVVDLSTTLSAATSITHMADGGGWATEVLLVNATDIATTGTFQFLSPDGQNLAVSIDGQTNNQFAYSIPARSARRFRTAGTAAATVTGSIRINPAGGTVMPSGAAVLAARANNITVSETAIASAGAGRMFRLHAESSGNFNGGERGSILSGLGVSNPGTSAVTVNIEAANLDGTLAGSAALAVPAGGQFALLLNQIPGLTLPVPFSGTVWVTAPQGSLVNVTGLRARYNERSTPDLLVTAFPAFDEGVALAQDLSIAHIVESGGYRTRVIVLGNRSGQSSGNVQFFSQGGQPLGLGIR